MLGLPVMERCIFAFVVIIYLAAAAVAFRQLSPEWDRHRRLLPSLVALGVSLESLMLVFRAVAIQGIPLTGLFESMIVLTIVFALAYLFLSIVISQVWFGSIMVWLISAMIVLTAVIAKPATDVHAIARTPWAIAHGMSMVLAGATIAFAVAMAYLYLLARGKLKRKQLDKVIGKVPNIERLERMNLFALKSCFVLVTFGLISGLGLAVAGNIAPVSGLGRWLIDSKIILIFTAWLLLGIVLLIHYIKGLKGRAMAYMTVVVFVLFLFAIVGVTLFCDTKHVFSSSSTEIIETTKEV